MRVCCFKGKIKLENVYIVPFPTNIFIKIKDGAV